MPTRVGIPRRAERRQKLIVGFARGLSIHFEKLDDQIEGFWLGLADFFLGLLQRADDSFGFRRAAPELF